MAAEKEKVPEPQKKPTELPEKFLLRKEKESGPIPDRLKTIFLSRVKGRDSDLEAIWKDLWR